MRPLLTIVEGDGDMLAVPELVRRVLHSHEIFDVNILRPHQRGDLPKVKANFDRFFRAAMLENAPILCVLDFDCAFCDSAPREREALVSLARNIRPDQKFDACFMVKEYESLFLCDEATTRRVFGDIDPDRSFPADFEAMRDAKGWLSNARPKGFSYKPVTHQKKLTAQLDLAYLKDHSPSFRAFESALMALIGPE